MSEAEQIAAELQQALDAIQHELERIPSEQWTSAVTSAEGWTVGHTAHHIAEGYGQSRAWIQECVSTAQPVVLDPAVGIPRINEANARCLAEHNDEGREATLAFLSKSGRDLVATVRSLTCPQLEGPMMIVMDQPRPGRTVVLPMALRHANTHLESIRAALASASSVA